ncbi:MAG: type II secretion system F family protein [Micavibrio sp.]|nr:type II secretion system F family protein [Micavibrio sp.]
MPLRDALEAARDDAPPMLRNVTANLYESVKAGLPLHDALAMYPQYFTPTIQGLVAAGERTGKFSRVFERCRELLRRQAEHDSRMRRITRYPKISFVIYMGLALLQKHTALPYSAAALAVTVVCVGILRRYVWAFRALSDRCMLFIPVVGNLIRQDSLAVFADSLALAYSAGINLRQGLQIACDTIPNLAIRGDVEAAIPGLAQGKTLRDTFKDCKHFDALSLGMLRAGEASGNLDACLNQLAEYYNKKTDAALTAAQQFTGPALTIVMGAVVFWGI